VAQDGAGTPGGDSLIADATQTIGRDLWQPARVTRTFTAIVNPTAGGGEAHAALLPVAGALVASGAPVTTEYSRSMDHARELATAAATRGDVVIAVGGDGMVGGIAGAVVAASGVLGIVAAGRGNDFARELRMPKDPAALAALFVDAEPSSVDVIDAGGTIVLGSVYAGIDSVANQHANRSRFVPRRIVYELSALRAVIRWRPVSFEVTVDGERHTFSGYNIVAANSGYYGNGLHIAPDAAVDDGLLDIVAIEHMPKRRFATVMKEVENGTHVQRPEITVLRGREVTIAADRALPAYGDGESLADLPISVSIRAQGLRILRPVL
jgi:diacylglycerol kinase (ATP)